MPNKKETNENKDHLVIYEMKIETSYGNYTVNRIEYNQNKVGISLYEKILISVSALFIALSVLFIVLGIRNCKKDDTGLENEVKGGQIDKLLDD